MTPGTIYAGDGLVIEIQQPSVKDLRGRVAVFRNRKGLWGLIAQGFCNVNTRFSVFDVKWPGGTNDIIAYNMTDLCAKAKSDYFPPWATFVLEEAYAPCGGMHLTPFSCLQLRYALLFQCIYYKFGFLLINPFLFLNQVCQ
jgi:DDE superfamily endonuclease